MVLNFYSITGDAPAQAVAVAAGAEVAERAALEAAVAYVVAGCAVVQPVGPAGFFAAGRVAELVVDRVVPACVVVHVAGRAVPASVVVVRHCYEHVVHAGSQPAGFLLPAAACYSLLFEPFD